MCCRFTVRPIAGLTRVARDEPEAVRDIRDIFAQFKAKRLSSLAMYGSSSEACRYLLSIDINLMKNE